jgi:hypothetical protein
MSGICFIEGDCRSSLYSLQGTVKAQVLAAVDVCRIDLGAVGQSWPFINIVHGTKSWGVEGLDNWVVSM